MIDLSFTEKYMVTVYWAMQPAGMHDPGKNRLRMAIINAADIRRKQQSV